VPRSQDVKEHNADAAERRSLMDLERVVGEIKLALEKMLGEKLTRCETENDQYKLKVYKVVDVIRIDIKEKTN
jgi:hypothetical protein